MIGSSGSRIGSFSCFASHASSGLPLLPNRPGWTDCAMGRLLFNRHCPDSRVPDDHRLAFGAPRQSVLSVMVQSGALEAMSRSEELSTNVVRAVPTTTDYVMKGLSVPLACVERHRIWRALPRLGEAAVADHAAVASGRQTDVRRLCRADI